jgi:hypothetical protein
MRSLTRSLVFNAGAVPLSDVVAGWLPVAVAVAVSRSRSRNLLGGNSSSEVARLCLVEELTLHQDKR